MTIVLPETLSPSGRTFKELQDEALGQDFSDREAAKRNINDALADIARRTHLPLLETTSTISTQAGVQAYSLPSDRVRVLSIIDPDVFWQLDGVDTEWIDEAGSGSGRPQVFAEYAGQALFWPTPDASYTLTVRYLSQSEYLTDDAQGVSTVIPDQYAYMVVSFARSRAFAMEDDAQMAQFWRGEYERDLMMLKGDMGRRSTSRVRQVPGMWRQDRPITFQRP